MPLILLYMSFTGCFADITAKKKNCSDQKSVVIPIVMSTDDDFIRATVVSLTSMFENANPGTIYHINVLVPGDFGSKGKTCISSLKERYPDCKFEFMDMGGKYKIYSTEQWAAPAYYRLEAASLLRDVKKCIYIDGDTIVRHDLLEMYDIDVSDYFVGGVVDYCFFSKKRLSNHFKVLEIPNLKQYVCSGVLIMNLEKIRENGLEKKFLKLVQSKGKSLQYAEQDVINSVCYGKILCLPLKFHFLANWLRLNNSYKKNKFVSLYSTLADWEAKNPWIVHFAGTPKPWESHSKTIFHEEWWKYAKKTSLYLKIKNIYLNSKGNDGLAHNYRVRNISKSCTPTGKIVIKKKKKHF